MISKIKIENNKKNVTRAESLITLGRAIVLTLLIQV